MSSKERKGVNIDHELAREIESLPDSVHESLSSMTRRLLTEAINSRKGGRLEPETVQHAFNSWSKSELIEHLDNLVNFIMRMHSEELRKQEVAEVALHFVMSLIEQDDVMNEDIVLLSQLLEMSPEETTKLTKIRNYAIKQASKAAE